MKALLLCVILLLPIVFIGCAEKIVYVDRIVEKKIPVACKTKDIIHAKKGVNDADTLSDIRRERDELREANAECK